MQEAVQCRCEQLHCVIRCHACTACLPSFTRPLPACIPACLPTCYLPTWRDLGGTPISHDPEDLCTHLPADCLTAHAPNCGSACLQARPSATGWRTCGGC